MKGLYLVTDESALLGKDLLCSVEQAIRGGVAAVQLREKTATTRAFVEKALEVKAITDRYGVPLIINDRIDVALACGAAGVHIGQSDMHYAMVRSLMPEGTIIGLSVENMEQVVEANGFDVDYIAASPVFSTPTKSDTLVEWGLAGVSEIRRASRHPLVAIGGIGVSNIATVSAAGADSIAVVSAVLSADDPCAAARELCALL